MHTLPPCIPQVYTPDAQILITAAVKGSREELEAGLRKFINTQQPATSLARLTWDHEAAWVHDYAQEVLGGQEQGLVCFKVRAEQGLLRRPGWWPWRLLTYVPTCTSQCTVSA